MKTSTPILNATIRLTALLLMAGSCLGARAGNWPAWRGDAAGSGITTEKNLPLEWSTERNIRWRAALPERGNSTPVVWGERVFITQAIEAENRRTLMCFHRSDGRLLWQKGVVYSEPERTHKSNPYCSASAVTDGERVIVSFGSAGLACYDMDGRELWRRDLGKLDHIWGNASSPVLYGDLCIHYHGPADKASLLALDKKTGKTVWKFDEPAWDTKDRTDGFKGKSDGVTGSWSTPLIIKAGKRDELIMSFPMEVRAFDPKTGAELWRCAGLNPLVYDSAMAGNGTVVAMGGYYGNSLAVKAGGKGDVTGKRLWHQVRAKGGIGTGVIKDGRIYFGSGQVACQELATGNDVWEQKIPGVKGGSWSSMLLAGDRIYLPFQSGDIAVFKFSPKFELIAVNSLKEKSNSSLAASNGELFFRTEKTLWCIAASKAVAAGPFNGKDLNGWTAFSVEPQTKKEDVWSVRDGVIVCKGEPMGWLATEKSFTSFKLSVEWRWPGQPGNSGVFLRIGGEPKALPRCFECQLKNGDAGTLITFHGLKMDGDAARLSKKNGGEKTGDITIVKKIEGNEKPPGEWNLYEIELRGGSLKVSVNGKLVNEATGCEVVAGPIALQSEGGEVHFRNLRLTPLE